MNQFVPLAQADLGEVERERLLSVFDSGRLALGPEVRRFEESFAKAVGSRFAVAVNSGTSGLHLAVRALGIGSGDEVITSPFSFVASANCLLFEGARPVFVDIEADGFNIDPAKIAQKIGSRTKGILPVHVFGEAARMSEIAAIAKVNDLAILEDACESIMAYGDGYKVGQLGAAAVYGFYPNKQITTGEGGMITTDDESIYDACLSMRNQGRATDMQWLTHVRLGYNYRMSELTAALGVGQIERIDQILRQRREAALRYFDLLEGVEGVRLPIKWAAPGHSWFVFPVRIEPEKRDGVLSRLNEAGVESKAYFSPCIHLQEFYMRDFGYQEGDFPEAELRSRETLILPFFTKISAEQQQYVADSLRGAMRCS